MILFRLSTHPDPTWDCQIVRNSVDLVQVLQDVVQLIKQAGIEAGENSEHDLFTRFGQFLHDFQSKVHASFTSRDSASRTVWHHSGAMPSQPGDDMIAEQNPTELSFMDLGSDVWLGNIFGWA